MSKELVLGMLVGAVGGAAGSTLLGKIKKKIKNSESTGENGVAVQSGISFDELFRNRTVVDTISMSILLPWYRAQKEQYINENCTLFLAKVTEQTAQMFCLGEIPAEFNRDNCTLQVVAVQREQGYVPEEIHLVTFTQMDDSLLQRFSSRDYIVVID